VLSVREVTNPAGMICDLINPSTTEAEWTTSVVEPTPAPQVQLDCAHGDGESYVFVNGSGFAPGVVVKGTVEGPSVDGSGQIGATVGADGTFKIQATVKLPGAYIVTLEGVGTFLQYVC